MTLNASAKILRNRLLGITVLNKQRQLQIDRKAAALFCAALLQSLKQEKCALSIVFVSTREIQFMNRRYRGRDYATDVLSFFYGRERIEGMRFLGEILISPAVAADQAIRYGVTSEKELRKLLVHGTLHLLGYDHETDEGQMNQMQAKLIHRIFFSQLPFIIPLKASR
jgi:probable rRNA maturation factor